MTCCPPTPAKPMPLDLPKKIGFCLTCDHVRFDEARSQRFCKQTSNKVSLQCELGCPLRLHDVPPFPQVPQEYKAFFSKEVVAYRAAWRMLHIFPATLPEDFDPEQVRRWLKLFPSHHLPAGCPCRLWYAMTLALMPPDPSSRTALFRWTVAIHNAKNKELGKPEISCARAARIYGVMHLLPPEEIAADNSGPIRLLALNGWGMGDALMIGAALRELSLAYPGEFEIAFRGAHSSLHYLSGLIEPHGCLKNNWTPDLVCDWRKLEDPTRHRHAVYYLAARLAEVVNRPIPVQEVKPWLRLSDEEKKWPAVWDKPYIACAFGHKLNLTTKAYPHWQQVIDGLNAAGIAMVRLGSNSVKDGDVQPKLSGVTLNLVSMTTVRAMMRVVAHPLCMGVLCIDTSLAHVAAAFDKPAVVVAGDRLNPIVVQYPGAVWLRHHLPCADCMMSRIVPLGPKYPWVAEDAKLCTNPDGDFAKCMSIIAPAEVVEAVRKMVAGWKKSE